jgi:large subunit ribosomal protein L25
MSKIHIRKVNAMNNRLIATERVDFRKSALHQLREQGNIPSIVYGKHEESKPIAVKRVDFFKVIQDVGRNGIISLEVNGKSENVMLKDFQYNPINHKIFHVDFQHINLAMEIHAHVNVELTGAQKSEGSGILQQSLHEISITAKPKDIPEKVEVDISNIKIGHAIKIGDIRQKYSNITINHEDDEVIVTLLASKKENEVEKQDALEETPALVGSEA